MLFSLQNTQTKCMLIRLFDNESFQENQRVRKFLHATGNQIDCETIVFLE